MLCFCASVYASLTHNGTMHKPRIIGSRRTVSLFFLYVTLFSTKCMMSVMIIHRERWDWSVCRSWSHYPPLTQHAFFFLASSHVSRAGFAPNRTDESPHNRMFAVLLRTIHFFTNQITPSTDNMDSTRNSIISVKMRGVQMREMNMIDWLEFAMLNVGLFTFNIVLRWHSTWWRCGSRCMGLRARAVV